MDYDYNVVRDPCNSDSDSEGNACEEISVWSSVLAIHIDSCLDRKHESRFGSLTHPLVLKGAHFTDVAKRGALQIRKQHQARHVSLVTAEIGSITLCSM